MAHAGNMIDEPFKYIILLHKTWISRSGHSLSELGRHFSKMVLAKTSEKSSDVLENEVCRGDGKQRLWFCTSFYSLLKT